MYEGDSFTSLQKLAATAESMGVSAPDASAFLLAERLDALLLTGDGYLRKQSEARGVTVCGVLWVLDMLVWHEVIDCAGAIRSLQQMLERGARLPPAECERRVGKWEEDEKIRPREVPRF